MAATKITVNNHGPLRVEGDLTLADSEGNEYGLGGRESIFLCRCGLSQNKPFCDGAHRTGGFQSACQAFDPPAPKATT
jgi:CDGSH-type Zn-finger protein